MAPTVWSFSAGPARTSALDRCVSPRLGRLVVLAPRHIDEVHGPALAQLAVRLMMVDAAAWAGLNPDRLSFAGTLRVLRRAIPRFQRGLASPELAPPVSIAC